ncbi:MAG: COG3400 family protein [Campylobacterota bacterium]
MREILVLADGVVAKTFINWLEKNRIVENKFTVVYYNDALKNDNKNIDFVKFDPTSYVKLATLLGKKFSDIFVIMANKTDCRAVYDNIRYVDDKVHIVMYDKWGFEIDDTNLLRLDGNELLANHLFDQIPNVPVYAKNVGLGQGEIMEVLVPLGSSYSYRYIGSVQQRKFTIAALYRNSKLLLAKNNMIIKPNDTLLIIGKPKVLENVFYAIKQKGGQFPAPYGKDIYLILDMYRDYKDLFSLLQQALYLKNKFETKLIIRTLNISKLQFLNELKEYSSQSVELLFDYRDNSFDKLIQNDLSTYNLGLVCIDKKSFAKHISYLHKINKPVYRSGDFELSAIDAAAAIMTDEYDMETISTTVFDIADKLDLGINLYDYDPEGDFKSTNFTVEHFEALANVHSRKLHVTRDAKNPILALREQDAHFQVLPFSKNLLKSSFLKLFSTNIKDFFLTLKKHPQIFIPIEEKNGD